MEQRALKKFKKQNNKIKTKHETTSIVFEQRAAKSRPWPWQTINYRVYEKETRDANVRSLHIIAIFSRFRRVYQFIDMRRPFRRVIGHCVEVKSPEGQSAPSKYKRQANTRKRAEQNAL